MSFRGKKSSLNSTKQRLYLLIASKLAKVLLCEDVLNTATTSLHDDDPSHDRANTLQSKPASDISNLSDGTLQKMQSIRNKVIM